jgi:hypothetical protein
MADQKMSHENDRKLDEMLDAMLSAYSAAQPRPGVEARILANVQEQAGKSTRWGFRWTWAVAALATAVLIIAVYISRHLTQPVEPQVAARPQQPKESAPVSQEKPLTTPQVTASVPSARHSRRQNVRATRAAADQVIAVKQDVFPSPSPLSEQEKLLLRYLTRTPREELIAQSRPDPPEEVDDSESTDGRPQNLTQIPHRSSNTK